MILDRYLIREICKPLVGICSILVIIFGSYTATEYLSDATSGLVLGRAVTPLILFKLIIALEFMLPISLYLSIVVALGRLYTDAELTALHACGVGIRRVLRDVLGLSLLLAAVTAALSLYVRPWAYEQFYQFREQAKSEFNIARMEPGSFLEVTEESGVLFAEEIDRQRNRAKGVFIQKDRGGSLQVILAKEAQEKLDASSGSRLIAFSDGHLYEFSREGDGDSISTFQQSTLALPPQAAPPVKHKRRAASTRWLANSDAPKDIAELQWRLSAPLATVLLALLAVPLSRTAPRQGKYAKLVAAVIIYILYYYVSAVAKSWVEQGVVGFLPGIWWVQVCLMILVFSLLWKKDAGFR